jgi:hypothetical protein
MQKELSKAKLLDDTEIYSLDIYLMIMFNEWISLSSRNAFLLIIQNVPYTIDNKRQQ